MSAEKCGFAWRDFHDDEHTCGQPPGEHDPHLCESCPVMEFVDVGAGTDDGEPVRPPWRLDVPEVPAHVTAFKDGNGLTWVRSGADGRRWSRWSGDDAIRYRDMLVGYVIQLGGLPLVECEDPRKEKP